MNSLERLRLAVLPTLAFIALPALALEGVVKEEGTGRPIENAFVVARWTGQRSLAGIEGRSGCYHVVFTRTDAAGRFSVPDTSWNVNPLVTDRERYVSVYAPGYQLAVGGSDDPKFIRLVKRTGTPQEQFDKVKPTTGLECTGPTDKQLLPLFTAVRNELRSLASNTDQRRKILDWDIAIDSIELGQKEARQRQGQRLTEFLRSEANLK